jgi:hypothetical protein
LPVIEIYDVSLIHIALPSPTFLFREIQQVLVEIGDKDSSFIGSCEWIGAIELSFVLDKLLGVSSLFFASCFFSTWWTVSLLFLIWYYVL